MKRVKLVFLLSIAFLIFIFLFLPHTIELTGTLETWFPYKGLTLYKDISMFHFPLGRFILVPIHLLSNWNLELDPFVGLIVGVLSLYVIYVFGKKYLSNFATSVSMAFFTTFFWYFATAILYFHEMLIGLLLGIAILVFFVLQASKKININKVFLLGVILSLAEFSGQVATITVALFSLIALKKIKFPFYFAAGFLLPIIFLVIYFLSQNALAEFFYWNTIYYITYSGFRNTPLSELPWREIIAFYLPLLILLITTRHKFLSLLGLSTIPFIIFSIFHFHHLSYALPLLAIIAGLAIDSIPRSKHKYAFIIIFLILTIPIISWYKARVNPSPSFKIVNDVYPGDPMYDAVEWVKQNTNKNDKLMVFGDPLFYMRADRLPSARPAKSIPYSWEPLDKISREIRANSPDYWVTDTRSMKTISEVYKKQNMINFVNEELTSSYIKVATFKIWEIWKRQ